MTNERQPALEELIKCQALLDQIKDDLDFIGDELVEDADALTRLRGIHNSFKGLHLVVRSFPGYRRRAA